MSRIYCWKSNSFIIATKKQSITYLGTPQIIPQPVASQIPTYEDSGVRYQGYYKKNLGSGNYEIRKQTTRFYSLIIASGAFGSNLINRKNVDKNFFCTKAVIQFHGLSSFSATLAQMHIADVKGTNATTRFYFFPTHADGEMTMDFSDCPRLFQGEQFDFYCQYSLAASEFIIISLYGWEED